MSTDVDLVSNFRKVVSDLGNIVSEEDKKILLEAVDDLIVQSQEANRAAINQEGIITTARVSSAGSSEKPKKKPRTKLEKGLIILCSCLFYALIIASGLAIYFSTSESKIASEEKASALSNYYGKCPRGFVKIAYSCYKWMGIRMNYNMAVQHCKTLGAKLAEPRTEWEDNELIAHARSFYHNYNGPQFWIGASDEKEEGKFVWASNGDRVKMFLWLPQQPNGRLKENCVAVNLNNGQRKWSDEQCSQRKDYVCQAELKYDFNPDSKRVCEDGYTYYRGICYRFLPEFVDFDSAVSNCKKTRGKLAEPRNEEVVNVAYFLLKNSADDTWLGATDNEKEGTFKWLSNNQVVALRMYEQDGRAENCLQLTSYLNVNDYGCTNKIHAVCQMPTKSGFCFRPTLCYNQKYLCFSCIPVTNGPKCRLVQLNSYSSKHKAGYKVLYPTRAHNSYRNGRCIMQIKLASLGNLSYREKYDVVDNVVYWKCLYSIQLKFQMEFWSQNNRNIRGKFAMEMTFWSNRNPKVFTRLRCRYRP